MEYQDSGGVILPFPTLHVVPRQWKVIYAYYYRALPSRQALLIQFPSPFYSNCCPYLYDDSEMIACPWGEFSEYKAMQATIIFAQPTTYNFHFNISFISFCSQFSSFVCSLNISVPSISSISLCFKGKESPILVDQSLLFFLQSIQFFCFPFTTLHVVPRQWRVILP